MSRRLVASLVVAAIPVGTLCAPFLHAHVADDGHHPTAVHSHVAGHDRGHHHHGDQPADPHASRSAAAPHDRDHGDPGAALHAGDDERAIYLQASVAVSATMPDIPLAPPACFTLATPPEQPAHASVEVTHGHDPPLLPAVASRPPPHTLQS